MTTVCFLWHKKKKSFYTACAYINYNYTVKNSLISNQQFFDEMNIYIYIY